MLVAPTHGLIVRLFCQDFLEANFALADGTELDAAVHAVIPRRQVLLAVRPVLVPACSPTLAPPGLLTLGRRVVARSSHEGLKQLLLETEHSSDCCGMVPVLCLSSSGMHQEGQEELAQPLLLTAARCGV